MPRTVRTPPQLDAIFDKSEDYFSRFFRHRREDPSKGTIEISNERFVLVRGAALSFEFFERVKDLFTNSERAASAIAGHLLFDIAHALGKADASHFHQSMGLTDPISKLAAGPVYFAHAGWAFVDISAESKPEPNENYYLLYDHPYSFEADAWIRAGRRSDFPICFMNAGYSSGWCEESFGLPLVAVEVSCRAKGDAACRFIMAPPGRIGAHVERYFRHDPPRSDMSPDAEIWKPFMHDWGREAWLEKALQESEKNYRNLFELSPDSITVWDANAVIQAVNKTTIELLGYEKLEDLVGKSWESFIVPEDIQACAEDLGRIVKSGGVSQIEFRMIRKDGSRFFAQGRARVVLDDKGKPTRFIAAARDITDLKQAEAELRESERAYRDLFQASPYAIVVWTLNGIIAAANRAAATLLGYAKGDDLVGRRWMDFVIPEDRVDRAAATRRAEESGGLTEAKFRMQRKDGTHLYVEGRLFAALDDAGQPVRTIAIARDITDRIRAEAELRESERAYRELFELSPDGIIAFDANDIIQAANIPAARLVGFTKPEDLVGRRWVDFVIPEERPALVGKVRAVQESGGVIEAEFQATRADGSRTFMQTRLRVASGRTGQPVQNIAISRDISARKQAEAAIYLSEARFRSAFENAGHGMALVGRDGHLLKVNAAFCRIMGYSDEELLGRGFRDIAYPEEVADTAKNISRLHGGEIPVYEAEKRFVRKDGKIVWVQINASMVRDATGVVSYHVTQLQDITARKQAEAALYLSEAQFRSAFENTGHGMALVGLDGRFLKVNRAFCRIVGYSEDEMLARSFQELTYSEDVAKSVEAAIRMHNGEIPYIEMEKRYVRKDGGIVWVQLNVGLVHDAAGAPLHHVTQVIDITARKQAEAAVYLSEARFRSAFENAGHGMALVHLDGRFFRVNRAFCRITGYSEDEMLARTFPDIVYPEDLPDSYKNLPRLIKGEIPVYESEKRYIHKDGEMVWVQLNVGMVRDATGAPLHYVTQVQDITGRKKAEAELRTRALHDSLTGLPNRAAFLERLDKALASCARGAKAFAVHYLDLDGFKDVNDTLGHAEGDHLLQAIAARLENDVRESDIIARFGGDEFAVLQTNLNNSSDAGMFAAKLTELLAMPYQIDGREMCIAVSIGISVYDPAIADPEAMLVQADLALYRAKAEGGNRYCFHSADLDREVRERVQLTGELRAALDRDELELYYQPQVDLVSGRIVGLEALARWNHPQRGLLMPESFIHIAESSRIIDVLGHWALDQACRQIRAWRDQGIAPPRLAINVSAAELHPSSRFEHFFTESVKKWSIAPGDIELEVTESVLMETSVKHGDVLARLNHLGVSIAIDDFGTGYSSLAYLSSYPMGCLKIAQQFILGIPDNAKDVAITNATLSLARKLGIKVIAEGIETKAQLDFLISAGAEIGQGFYFSKAVQAGCATELLRRGSIEPTA